MYISQAKCIQRDNCALNSKPFKQVSTPVSQWSWASRTASHRPTLSVHTWCILDLAASISAALSALGLDPSLLLLLPVYEIGKQNQSHSSDVLISR